MDVSLLAWGAVVGAILVMLAVDLFLHRDAHEIKVKEAAIWSGIWVTIGVIAGGVIWAVYGAEFGQQYFAGYVIEKSLAVDNVFVWAIIFSFFAVPREYQHRVLFLGVLGALVFRAIFIAAGSALIASFSFVLYIFALFLIWTGWKMWQTRNSHADPSKSKIVAWWRRRVPTTDEYHGQKLLVRKAGKLMATPLLLVLVMIELTDIVFAIDSIPAIFAVTSEPFLVFAANAFAILGLRAMYFLLADLIHRFIYLKVGLALVLVWVGIKMFLVVDIYKIPTTVSLLVVTTIITVSIVASLRATRGQGRRPIDVGPHGVAPHDAGANDADPHDGDAHDASHSPADGRPPAAPAEPSDDGSGSPSSDGHQPRDAAADGTASHETERSPA
jgi:tellurite resistance protein TerC